MSVEDYFVSHIDCMGREITAISKGKGFGVDVDDGDINVVGLRLSLIHSEISEALEAARKDYPASEKIPDIGNFEEELADAVICCMDLARRMELDLGRAIVKKVAYNSTRPYMHGGKKA